MVECQLPKLDVAGSSPVSRSMFSMIYESVTLTSITTFKPQSIEAQRLIPLSQAVLTALPVARILLDRPDTILLTHVPR